MTPLALRLADIVQEPTVPLEGVAVMTVPSSGPAARPEGEGAIYAARTTGTTFLSAVGSPPCTSGACPLVRLGFTITITVN